MEAPPVLLASSSVVQSVLVVVDCQIPKSNQARYDIAEHISTETPSVLLASSSVTQSVLVVMECQIPKSTQAQYDIAEHDVLFFHNDYKFL